MSRCPITYEPLQDDDAKYSKRGLAQLSPKLENLEDLPFTAKEQRQEAAARASKMSIQGVQAKLSARLSVSNQQLEIVDTGGTYIIKPQSDTYPELPENEGISMYMAAEAGISVPLNGMVYSKDGSLSYFIKRFDRYSKGKKYHVEDFAQLTENKRDTKYSWSMEKLVPVLDFCTFPKLEKSKLFHRILFCFLTGNEDMHLKNFSLLIKDGKIELSPAYDLLNTTIAIKNAEEEIALPLKGKKKKIKKTDLIDYFAFERLGLSQKSVDAILSDMSALKETFQLIIGISFLSDEMQEKYIVLMNDRFDRLGL